MKTDVNMVILPFNFFLHAFNSNPIPIHIQLMLKSENYSKTEERVLKCFYE